MPFISVSNVTKSYPVGGARLPVLKHLDVELQQGEMVAVVGASGVGNIFKGEAKRIEGNAKEEFGKAAGDRSTEWGGKVDQAKGELQKKAGEVEREGRREERIDEPASR